MGALRVNMRAAICISAAVPYRLPVRDFAEEVVHVLRRILLSIIELPSRGKHPEEIHLGE